MGGRAFTSPAAHQPLDRVEMGRGVHSRQGLLCGLPYQNVSRLQHTLLGKRKKEVVDRVCVCVCVCVFVCVCV